MSQNLNTVVVIGIDVGKNSYHVVGHDQRGAIVLHQRWSRSQVAARFANMPPCLIGMEACVETFSAVEQMINWATKWSLAQEFDRRRSQCNALLGEAFAAKFSGQQQRRTLDTLHHQFISNMKTKYTRPEIAALVGYVSNETAVTNSSKPRLAWPDQDIREVPIPTAAQVKQMRELLDLHEQRQIGLRARRAMKNRNRVRLANDTARTK